MVPWSYRCTSVKNGKLAKCVGSFDRSVFMIMSNILSGLIENRFSEGDFLILIPHVEWLRIAYVHAKNAWAFQISWETVHQGLDRKTSELRSTRQQFEDVACSLRSREKAGLDQSTVVGRNHYFLTDSLIEWSKGYLKPISSSFVFFLDLRTTLAA